MAAKFAKRDGTATCTLSPGNTSLAGRQSLTMRYSPVHAGCAVSSSTASAALSQSIEVGAGARLFFSPTCGARYQRVQIDGPLVVNEMGSGSGNVALENGRPDISADGRSAAIRWRLWPDEQRQLSGPVHEPHHRAAAPVGGAELRAATV